MDGRPTPPAPLRERLLLTAASEAYAPSLLALLGSLTLHWPSHPPVRVYDIGLAPSSRETLERHGVEVVAVPAFCPHWRRHFTWKPWCWADAPARDVLWIDAGVVVLDTLVLSDGVVYGGWKSPEQTPGQKVWVHRRTLLEDDRRHYAAHVATPGPARRPVPPPTPPTRRGLRAAWKSVFGPPERAIRHLLKGRRVREVRPYDGVRDA